MRTPIPESLEERIETIYEDAGYATKSEFVRDAVRHWLDETEDEHTGRPRVDEPHFRYEMHAYSDKYKISLIPTRDSPLNLSYSQSNLSFTYEDELLDRDYIESKLDDIPGVNRATFQTEPALVIYIGKDIERNFSAIVEDIFETLYTAINVETGDQFSGTREETLRRSLDQYTANVDR